MNTTVFYRGTREELQQLLGSVPQVLAGRLPDPYGLGRLLNFRLANAMLSQVQQDFKRKARGEVGKDGVKWAPLAPSTIRKRMAKERKAQGNRKTSKRFVGQFEIGIDTARMIRSLAAGVTEAALPTNPDTVILSALASISVGTNVPYAEYFHAGRGSKQPARPIVPLDGTIPAAWWPAILSAGARGVVASIGAMAGARS